MELGSYHILKKLATGGMAEIFLARHQSTEGFQRNLVIKRILSEYSDDPVFVQSFLDEAKLAGQLNHPNIVQIYDLGRIAKSYFIAMEYIQGYDLSALLRLCRREQTFLPLPVVVRIFCDVCSGLDYAHNACDIDGHTLGVVHRDVTPSNVIVSVDGPSKLVDFGIAKATAKGDGKTKTGTIKGKFAYLAPEQVLSQPIDRRVDVFAAGIMLYELLTNNNPFRGETEYQSLQNVVAGQIPRVASLRPEIPRGFDDIIIKALMRDPNERYPSCAMLMGATEIVADNAGITAHHSDVQDYLQQYETELTALNAKSDDDASEVSGEVLDAGARVTGVELFGEGMVLRTEAEDQKRARRPWGIYLLLTLLVVIGAAGLVVLRERGKLASTVAAPQETALEIVTDPAGASVLIDGVLRTGETPLRLRDVSLGVRYEVRVVKKNYRPYSGQVTLEQAGLRTIQLALAAAPKPRAAATPAPKEVKKEEPPPPKAPPPPTPVSTEPGKLRIMVQPWATVEIDGEKIGDTPFPARVLSPGKHKVVLTNADLNRRVVRTIHVESGKETVLREDLSRD